MGSATGDVGVLTTDRELVVRSWDAWLADVTGVPAELATGRPLADLFPEIEARGLSARLCEVVESGSTRVLAPAFHRYLIPCSPREPVAHFERMQQHITLAPLRAGSEVVGLSITVRDVTARRESERRLAERLRSADEATRLQAVEALAAAEASADLLVGAFDDASWRVRQAAVDAVADRDGEEITELLARVLREQHRDPSVLNATLSALAASGGDVLPPLLGLLESPDVDVRIYVALALGLRGDPRAAPALVRALDDMDGNVRFHALEALGRLRARSAAERVAEVAGSGEFSLAFAALDALAEIGDETVTPRILPLLGDGLLRSAALRALGALGGEEAVAPLTALLAPEGAAAAEAAAALSDVYERCEEAFGDGEVIVLLARDTAPPGTGRWLVEAFPEAAPAEWCALARVVGWLPVEGSEEVLVRALARADARAAAVDGLVRVGAPAVEALGRGISALDDGALRAAALALGRIGNPAAVPALLGLLDAEPEVVVAAAEALGSIGDSRAFLPLLVLLEHPQAAVRQAAIGALSSIGHPELRARVTELFGSPVAALRESAARIAGYFGYDECADHLLELCHDPDESVRRAAVEHLVYLDDPRVPAALGEVLRAAPAPTRAAAARALAQLPPAQAGDLLPTALGDGDLWTRYYAARSAGALGVAELAPRLEALALRDPAVPVRIAAARAVADADPPRALPALCALAAEPDPELRLAALAVLGRSAHPDALSLLGEALGADDPAERRTALDGLHTDAAAALAGRLAAVARTASSPEEARSALLALSRAGSADGVRSLLELAAEPRLRPLVVEVIAKLPAARAEVLGGELRGGPEAGRGAILAALPHMAERVPAGRLAAEALDDPSPEVRRAAAHALLRLDLRAAVAKSGG